MILICTGSRTWSDEGLLFRKLDRLTENLDRNKLWVYVGDNQGVRKDDRQVCPGADQLVRLWCSLRRVKYKIFHADWEKHGKKAGPLRNQEMIDTAEDQDDRVVCVAFRKGTVSRGTDDCIERARKDGFKIRITRG